MGQVPAAREDAAYRRGMNPRWLGVALIAAVVLAASVASNWSGNRMAGTPVAMELPGPPASGDCVATMADPWRLLDRPSPDDAGIIDYPTAEFGPCGAEIAGEVVSVDSGADPPPRITANDYLSKYTQCAIDAIDYTGSIPPVVQRSDDRMGILWIPQFDFRFTTVGPSRAQRAAGQQWSACIVGPGDGMLYAGRLQNVLTTGVLPGAFGTCLASADLTNPERVPCAQPHPVEILGSTQFGPIEIPESQLQRACVVYAGRAIRSADPTRAGTIHVQALTQHVDDIPLTGSQLSASYVACVASAPDGVLFDGSLVGVADGPLPVG